MYGSNKFSYHGKKIVAEDFFPYIIDEETGRKAVPLQVFASRMNVHRYTVILWRKEGLLPVCVMIKPNKKVPGGLNSCFLVSDLDAFFNENVYFSDEDL